MHIKRTRDICLKYRKIILMLFQVTFAILHNYFRPIIFSAENVVFYAADVV